MIDETMPHFHFYVFKPDREVAVVDFKGSFPDAAGTAEIFLLFLPLSVFDPNGGIPTAYTASVIFIFFSLIQTVLCQKKNGEMVSKRIRQRIRAGKIKTEKGVSIKRLTLSNFENLRVNIPASSSGSVIVTLGGLNSSACKALDSRRICSDVICVGAGCLFLTAVARGRRTWRSPPPPSMVLKSCFIRSDFNQRKRQYSIASEQCALTTLLRVGKPSNNVIINVNL